MPALNQFELMCYGLTAMLLVEIFWKKQWEDLYLFLSASMAGFSLELLAVKLTSIYHYNPAFYLNLGQEPNQFPLFGGFMWGGVTLYALRIAKKLHFNRLMTALTTGWLVVSMDLFLDVLAIRLNGGFWIWEGRTLSLEVNHHLFMGVLWVNFLGYLFETPALAYLTLLWREKKASWIQAKKLPGPLSWLHELLAALVIAVSGVAFVGAASALSLALNAVTDEYFACLAFLALWLYIFPQILQRIFTLRKLGWTFHLADWPVFLFWLAMYGFCIVGLLSQQILQSAFWYSLLAGLLAGGTCLLSLIQYRNPENREGQSMDCSPSQIQPMRKYNKSQNQGRGDDL